MAQLWSVYIIKTSPFSYISKMLQKRLQLLTLLCCVTANVSIDTVLHFPPTELHNLAIETGTHKSAWNSGTQTRWHSSSLHSLSNLASGVRRLAWLCSSSGLPVVVLWSDYALLLVWLSERLPMIWSLMLMWITKTLGMEFIYQTNVFEL